MEYVWMVLALALMVFVQTRDYQEAKVIEKMRAEADHKVARHYASLVAACMNGDAIAWQDPQTQRQMMSFCDPQEISK